MNKKEIEFYVDNFKTYKIVDIEILKKYIIFCLNSQQTIGDKHHILPRALFPQFSSFKNNPWNLSTLSPKDHYIAHALLHEALENYSVACAWYGMNNKNFVIGETLEIIGAETYETLCLKRNKLCSENAKNKVTAKNIITGEKYRVLKEEFDNDETLVGITKGYTSKHLKNTISVIVGGEVKRILSNDFDSKIHKHLRQGVFTAIDESGNKFTINKDDKRYISGELKALNKGKKFDENFKQNRSIIAKKRIKELNSNAKIICIFDKEDNPKFISYGNFAEVCKINKLSLKKFGDSYKFGIKVSSIKNDAHNNWYAKIMKRINLNERLKNE